MDRWVVCQDQRNADKRTHNHPAFENPHNLAIYRRFNPSTNSQIDLLSSAGCRTAQIKSLINVDPGSQPLVRDIHNVRSRLRDNWLNGRTPIQGLFNLIVASHWAHRTITSPEGTLLNLFFASPSGIRLARRFPTVLSLDCTYKTNRFNLPLLHIVGTTNTHRSFTIAMCFLTNEKQDQYEWALKQVKEVIYQNEDQNINVKLPEMFATDAETALINAIGIVFPDSVHILCVWHINQNIAKHCKNKFPEPDWNEFMKLWNSFVSSTSSNEYDTNLEAVTKVAKAHDVFDYLHHTWLGRTEKFVTLFTSKTHHFGNSSTSRVEGSHYRAKRFLNGRHNDFITCFNAFKRFEEHQTSEIMVLVGIERTKTLQGLPAFFKDVSGVISHFALKKLKSQWDLLSESPQKPCTHTFRGAWGLPCSHELASARETMEYLSPDLIHAQWKLAMEVAPETHVGLTAAARVKFDHLLDLPEHSLRKIYGEIGLLETGQYSLIPILNAEVKLDPRGRPRASQAKGKRPVSPEGRWKSDFELAEASKKPRVSKCSLCLTPGHNITTCPKRRAAKNPAPAASAIVRSTSPSGIEATSDTSSQPSTPTEEALLLDYNDMIEDKYEDEDEVDLKDSDTKDSFDLCHDSSPEDQDEDSDLCPFCNETLPSAPSKRLSDLKALLLAMPNWHTLSVSFFLIFEMRFCNSASHVRVFIFTVDSNWRILSSTSR